jgi:hypothetical protein
MKTYFLIIALFFGNLISAQTFSPTKVDTNYNVVISTNGLCMRSQPNLHSKKLIAVPYGEQVEIIDTNYYGKDTIGEHAFYYGGFEEVSIIPIVGYWVKAKYENHEGYMFNSFLGANWVVKNQQEEQSEYTIVYPEMQECAIAVSYNPQWHWYGLYNEKGKPALKKVAVSYFMTYYDNVPWLCTSTNDNKNLKLVIGSKMPMNVGQLGGAMYSYSEDNNSFFNWSEAGNFINETLLEENNLEMEDSFEEGTWSETKIIAAKNGKKQILNPESAFPSGIMLRADLDGDRKDDYILYFGEFYSELRLFLSAEADKEKEEVLKHVASFYFPDCC